MAIYRDHIHECALDFGVIGEQYVDVVYDWHERSPGDSATPDAPAYADISDVLLFIDGSKVSVKHWLTSMAFDRLEEQIAEFWQ